MLLSLCYLKPYLGNLCTVICIFCPLKLVGVIEKDYQTLSENEERSQESNKDCLLSTIISESLFLHQTLKESGEGLSECKVVDSLEGYDHNKNVRSKSFLCGSVWI